jgi:formylglycine-generating enzyme required for sulfatase activity
MGAGPWVGFLLFWLKISPANNAIQGGENKHMAGIFISYRRKENTKDARILFERLGKSFGRRVFMDTDGVSYGDDFERKINAQLDRCTVMLVLIGPGWEHLLDEHTGERRLDQSGDWVRMEIAAALRRDIRVIPVRIDRPGLPAERDLPEPLRALLKRQAFPLHLEQGFEQGMQDLVAAIRPYMGPTLALPGWAKAALPVVLLGGSGAYWQMTRPPVPLAPTVVSQPVAASRPTPLPIISTPQPLDRLPKDCADCPELVLLPKGSFVMGSPDSEKDRDNDEGPTRTVSISKAIAVGRYEVTRAEFARFVTDSQYKTEAERSKGCAAWDGKAWTYDAARNWRDPGFKQAEDQDHPVVCVSWNDTQEYLKWLNKKAPGKNFRLLSEAEWEYAARAGQGAKRFPWGDDLDYTKMCAFANGLDETAKVQVPGASGWMTSNCSDGYAYTAPVNALQPNAFGLMHMHGNALEWVQDVWHENYTGAPTDGTAWEAGGDSARRVLRGGSWYYIPRDLRSAYRIRYTPDYRYYYAGFRIARTFSL